MTMTSKFGYDYYHMMNMTSKFGYDFSSGKYSRMEFAYGPDQVFADIIKGDERGRFIADICRRPHVCSEYLEPILTELLSYDSIKCVEALITGQTPLTVDLNRPFSGYESGLYPLHYALALGKASPSMTELLLCYGARTDIKYTSMSRYPDLDQYVNMLPLQIALQKLIVSW